MVENQIIFEFDNPYETASVILEDDGRTVYLYLIPKNENLAPRAVWVRNRIQGGSGPDHESLKAGRPPLFPAAATRHPEGLPAINKENIEIIWYQEGYGLTLFEDGKLIAVVAPWGKEEGFYGYAYEASQANYGTFPLPESSGFLDRIEENKTFWKNRNDPACWASYRNRMLSHYESVYGKHETYYAVQRNFPTLAVVHFIYKEKHVFATLGMGNQNMPAVENYVNDPVPFMRSEVITSRKVNEPYLPGLLGRMAVYPWMSARFISHGHQYESGLGQPHSDFIFTEHFVDFDIPAPPSILVDDIYPVHFLYAVPVAREDLFAAGQKGADFILNKKKGKVPV